MDADENAIFAEINAHGRSTEQKQITVAFAYVALVGVAAGAIDDFVTGGSWSAAAAAAVLFILGVVVFHLTLIYRSWKVHYMSRTKSLAGKDWMEGAHLEAPKWPSADMTIVVTLALVVTAVGTMAGSNFASVPNEASFSQLAGILIGSIASIGIVASQFLYFRPWTKWREGNAANPDALLHCGDEDLRMAVKSTVLEPIRSADQEQRYWTLLIDGRVIEKVSQLELHHSEHGTLTYGRAPQGHDTWSFRESGLGGAVIVPYVRKTEGISVGVVEEVRPNQGGIVLNLPRGFIDPDESHDSAAIRELREETGIEVAREDLIPLPGRPGNPNSAFFETPGEDDGVRFYGFEIEDDFDSKSLHLLPWWEAVLLSDLFSIAGVARLLAHIHDVQVEWHETDTV